MMNSHLIKSKVKYQPIGLLIKPEEEELQELSIKNKYQVNINNPIL
jgi:hypothetical protein